MKILGNQISDNPRVNDALASEITDDEIVKRVLNGEKDMYEAIMRRYNQGLYRVIRSYLFNKNDVEDAMQETYLRAYEKLYQFRGEAAFSTWLIRIGINEAFKKIRQVKKAHIVQPDDNELQDHLLSINSDSMTPEKKAIQGETEK